MGKTSTASMQTSVNDSIKNNEQTIRKPNIKNPKFKLCEHKIKKKTLTGKQLDFT